MTLSRFDETDPGLKSPKYTYEVSPDGRYITISNGKEKIERSLEACQVMERSSGNPEPVREMYRGALEAFGKWKPETDNLKPETIVTIQGIKVYFDFMRRRFFAKVGKRTIRNRRLSYIEGKIRERK